LSVSEKRWRIIGLRNKATLCCSKEQRQTALAHKATFCETYPSFLNNERYMVLLLNSEKSMDLLLPAMSYKESKLAICNAMVDLLE
jgi:hypothetical protein